MDDRCAKGKYPKRFLKWMSRELAQPRERRFLLEKKLRDFEATKNFNHASMKEWLEWDKHHKDLQKAHAKAAMNCCWTRWDFRCWCGKRERDRQTFKGVTA